MKSINLDETIGIAKRDIKEGECIEVDINTLKSNDVKFNKQGKKYMKEKIIEYFLKLK